MIKKWINWLNNVFEVYHPLVVGCYNRGRSYFDIGYKIRKTMIGCKELL